jgi:hypothetical protein
MLLFHKLAAAITCGRLSSCELWISKKNNQNVAKSRKRAFASVMDQRENNGFKIKPAMRQAQY